MIHNQLTKYYKVWLNHCNHTYKTIFIRIIFFFSIQQLILLLCFFQFNPSILYYILELCSVVLLIFFLFCTSLMNLFIFLNSKLQHQINWKWDLVILFLIFFLRIYLNFMIYVISLTS